MHIDKEKRIWFSKEEMKVITAVLHVLSYEMWKFEKSKEFRSIKIKFSCSLEDLKYVKDWFASLYSECKDNTYIFLFESASKRLEVIHIALEKCFKNFKEYEVSDLGHITKKELNNVLKSFKKLSLELEKVE
ncbi:MAG: hypothetical protein HRU36_00345 [Rickettsiales bacterium]|nr:hypothetical protein [Rickettsiales bacterium]